MLSNSKMCLLFHASANKIKSSESFSKQATHRRTQLIIAAHNCHTKLSYSQHFIWGHANAQQQENVSPLSCFCVYAVLANIEWEMEM